MSADDTRVADVLIRDLVADFPEPRPAADAVATVLAEALRQRRRRRRGGAFGSLVVAAMLALATVALTHGGAGSPVAPAAGPAGQVAPDPPDGTQWVNRGRAALAVPRSWRHDVVCGDLGLHVPAFARDGGAQDPERCFAGASQGSSWVRLGDIDTAVGAAAASWPGAPAPAPTGRRASRSPGRAGARRERAAPG